MSNWRPEGWRNHLAPGKAKYDTWYPKQPCDQCWTAFESGADAYGEALKKEGYHSDMPMDEELLRFIAHTAVKYSGKPGTWVFIPDDKQEG